MFNSICRFLTTRKLHTYGAQLKQTVNHPIQAEALDRFTVCNKCGGYFVPAFLTPAYHGTVLLFEDENVGLPHFESVYYCQPCAPRGPIRLTLRLAGGDIADDIIFRIQDGYLQQVDEDTGEDQYVVSIEEYAHTFCEECGELIEETQCRSHRPSPVQPEPGLDASKKRGRKR